KIVRKLRWPVAILTTMVFLGIAAVLIRKPANEFPELRPYVIGEHVDYIQSLPYERTGGVYAYETHGPAGSVHHVYWVKGIAFEQLVPLLKARAAKKGLPVSLLRTDTLPYFEAVKNHVYRFNGLRAMQ